jgi:tRNA threonylcarbamoyladenosine biosynthesis protein TsaE
MLLSLENPAATHEAGRQLAATLAPGAVIALTGPLGAGKTHFAAGIVAALGSPDPVTSPTFTLVHEYHGGRLPIFHFDLYRLTSPAALLEIGWDDYLDARGIMLVEWADLFPELMPPATRWAHLALAPLNTRTLTIASCPPPS